MANMVSSSTGNMDAWRRVAERHIADQDVTGTLARALATVLDPDIFVVKPVRLARGMAWWGHVLSSGGACLISCPHREWR